MKKENSLNHGLNGLMDCTEKNLWNLRNPNESVIQTESADILNLIPELI